ncbi:MAG: hypothetical protein FD143_1843 [Ignavibacteria bacterium]|nr:MAG: hypothetical protein FD143_1843 [Ignavibacteria bacterium]KAF0157711.1 MAG: hypothetical protein FD188_2690 [Ignavibacteria bacterium]
MKEHLPHFKICLKSHKKDHSPSSNEKRNKASDDQSFFYTPRSLKFIYKKLPKYLKGRRIKKEKIAIILFLFELYRMHNGIYIDDDFFPEWRCDSPTCDFLETSTVIVNFAKEVSETYGFSIKRKVIEWIWKTEFEFLDKDGWIKEGKNLNAAKEGQENLGNN